MTVAGNIVDVDTGQPLPGVTVSVTLRGVQVYAVVVDGYGRFSIGGVDPESDLLFTHAEYYSYQAPADSFVDGTAAEIGMVRRVGELPEVVVVAPGISYWGWLGIAAVLYFIVTRKK